MKTTHSPKQARNQGSVLVISLTILAVGAIVLASYLTLVQTQTNSVARSQTWNSAIAVTEAGIEEGLAEVNKGSPSTGAGGIDTSPWGWTNSITSDGWSAFNSNSQSTLLTRNVFTNNAGTNTYTVTIDISSGVPTITSAGTVAFTSTRWGSHFNWDTSSLPGPFLAAGGTSTATNVIIGRKIQVQTVQVPLFNVAILTRSNFNMNGNGTTVDSFDSSNTNYSTAGQWDVNKRKANGTIATDSGVTGDIGLGNGNIYGHVYTGPGSAQNFVQVGPNGAVGDVAWNTSNSGIESNYWAGNFNTAIPDVPTPTFSGQALPTATNGNITLPGGNYTTATGPSSSLIISAPTTLWVQGSFAIPNVTFTNSGSLIVYVGKATGSGDSLSVSGNGNSPGYAANLQIFGLPSLTSITLHGNDALIAAIYAPEADYSGGGGGNNRSDSAGSLVVNSITLNGHWNFHYDEHLVNAGASRGWIAKNWTEVKYP